MINRAGILGELEKFFDSLYADKKAEENYYSFMSKKHGVNRGKFNGYVFGMLDRDRMSDEELFWFASYNQTKIRAEEYYSAEEIKKYSRSKVKKTKPIFPVIFYNVLQISDDQFVTTINTKYLYELYNNGALAYNLKTQRAPKVFVKDGIEKYAISINRFSVSEIRNLLGNGLFISNDLTFNVGDRDDNDFYYDPNDGRFVLRSGMFDILDGFHRTRAIIQVMNEEPDFSKEFVLNIMAFPEQKAKRFVAQQDKRNKIKSSFAKSIDDTRFDSVVAKKINEESNQLRGQIKAIGKRSLDFGKTAGAIGFFYKMKSMQDATNVKKEIISGMDAIFGDDYISVDDTEMRKLLAYIRFNKDNCSKKGYENFKSYLNENEEEMKTLNTIRRAAKTLAEK